MLFLDGPRQFVSAGEVGAEGLLNEEIDSRPSRHEGGLHVQTRGVANEYQSGLETLQSVLELVKDLNIVFRLELTGAVELKPFSFELELPACPECSDPQT
jgi:hypothetical protein